MYQSFIIDKIGLLVSCFLLSFFLATWLIRWGIPKLGPETETDKGLPGGQSNTIFDFRSTGFWIGFFETLLVFVFVYEGEYGALAIIIGAKEFVRKEQIQKNPTYYLLGTLVNVSVALVFALIARNLLTR